MRARMVIPITKAPVKIRVSAVPMPRNRGTPTADWLTRPSKMNSAD
jgi:hypothetical protein